MPNLTFLHQPVVYIHILGVFLFLLAHGISAGVVWRLRTERDPAAVRTLVDFSARSIVLMGIGATVWFFSGIFLGFSGNYWTTGRYWLWASLVVAIVVVALMTPMGRIYLNRVRIAVGLDPRDPKKPPAETPIDAAALDAAIRSGRPGLLVAIGFGGVAILSWLMMFKPF